MSSNKFQFVDEEIIGEVKNDNASSEKVKEDAKKEANKEEIKVPKGLYFSFELRVIASILVILVLFVGACFLGLKVFNHTGTQKVNYVENCDFTYQVCLKNGTCEPENLTYVSADIDTINIAFKYNAKYEDKIDVDNSYRVMAIITAYDKDNHSLLFKNENEKVEKKNFKNVGNSFTSTEVVKIGYAQYKESFKRDYPNTYNQIEIVFYVDENSDTRKVASLIIPFSNEKFELSKSTTNTTRSAEAKINVWDMYSIIYTVAASILTIVSLVLIYRTTRLVLKVTSGNKSEYEEAVENILKANDSIITVAGEGFESIVPEEKEVIKLESFDELVKVRENVDKQIVYNKINNVKCEFTLEDDKSLYKYVMKEADFTEEDKNKLENK